MSEIEKLTPEEIALCNPIIARYMGLHPFKYPLSKLKFHVDWNWLMQVVAKIGKEQYHPVTLKTIEIPPLMMFEIDKINLFAPRIKVYRSVVEFIVWYNKQLT